MKQGFDNRIVSYEEIHSIDPGDFSKLIDAVDPHPGEIILDAMCGYGAVGKGILERIPEQANIFFLDESEVQIKRARENLPQIDPGHFIVATLPNTDFEDAFFDKIVIKMGLHEVSLTQQVEVLKDFKRILKSNGKLIVWDIMLNAATQSLFQDVIRKKDELAGFDLLTKERYFFREDEFLSNLQAAGFHDIAEFHAIAYRFSSKKRLGPEFGNDISKLEAFNDFIRTRFSDVLKADLKYEDLGDDIQFTITKKIYTARA